jgi:glycosyltransferase involved in cell wall biosynthesis/2-polyprenyl-3-methyl-5-hydroxy-6-metoxy-1,4-benzoquinol methylase
MNILIFSHTSSLGGAERALVDFLNLLSNEHQLSVMLPSQEGELVDRLRGMGVKCGVLPTGFSLPNPANTLLNFCDPKIETLVSQLKKLNYDLVISNTIVTLLGMLIGRELNIPCITYVHEYLPDKDLAPHGCSSKFYLKLISSLSNHLLCASEYAKTPFLNQEKCSVLYPFAPYPEFKELHAPDENLKAFSLLVVGTKNRRKNTHFAITVLKALRLRGIELNLHIVGSDNFGSYKLNKQLTLRSEKNAFTHPHLLDPFKIPGKKINLICSHTEPFGLTVPESLARGIPVVASDSGGPSEILPTEWIYDVDDVDQCVRVIEKIVANYEEYSSQSKIRYLKLIEKNSIQSRKSKVSKAIELAVLDFNNESKEEIPLNLNWFKKILNPVITADQIIKNISVAFESSSHILSETQVHDFVKDEVKFPGSSVLKDMNTFDVVPFGHSENMNHLYKSGIGLAIELVANIKDKGKQNMIAFIVLRLQELRLSNQNPKILCMGDDLGIYSIILASCGLDVDYIDFDQSLMSRCAQLNLKTAMDRQKDDLKLSTLISPNKKYDVIISLEDIQKVTDPRIFLKYLSEKLVPEGLLFISECFDGIYDRSPTNLYLNEKFASTLPILAAPFFKMVDVNTLPLGKPYMFSKNLTNVVNEDFLEFFYDPFFLESLMTSKRRIGF